MESFAEPGVIRQILEQSGLEAVMTDDSMASSERDDVSFFPWLLYCTVAMRIRAGSCSHT